ncbi:hypothetical protein B7463_g3871, partial [Scytalidium lignicola]
MAFPFNNQQQQQHPFWNFARAFDQQHPNGEGVDHHTPEGHFWGPGSPPPYPQGPTDPLGSGFPFLFAGPRGFGYVPGPHQEPFGRGLFGGGPNYRGRRGHGRCYREGGRGRDGHRGEQRQDGDQEQDENEHGSRSGSRSPHRDTERAQGEQADGNESETLREGSPRGPHNFRRGFGHRGRGFHHGPRGWHRGGFGRFGGGPGAAPPPIDLSALAAAFQDHPWAQTMREYLANAGINLDGQSTGTTARNVPEAPGDDDNNGLDEEVPQNFAPPVDMFTTSSSYVLHVSLPGAKKEDLGVNWDADSGELNIAGVIYRNGDEEFLNSIIRSERKIGMFERIIKLPPPGITSEEKEEIDGDHIVAKLEDGVLVVTVPKVEREWTEIKKVDIL